MRRNFRQETGKARDVIFVTDGKEGKQLSVRKSLRDPAPPQICYGYVSGVAFGMSPQSAARLAAAQR